MSYHLLSELNGAPDVQLSVLILNEGRLSRDLATAGVRVQVIDESIHSFPKLIGLAREFLRMEAPDLVHSHRYKENLLALLATRGNRQVALVATQHGLPEVGRRNATFSQAMKSRINFYLLSRFFDRTVAVSHDIGAHLAQDHSFRNNGITVIHNGIPIPDAAPRDDRGSCMVIGSSGRLFEVKDYPLMVEVAALVCGESKARFALAGEGPTRQQVEVAIERHGLREGFTLTGHLDNMDAFYRGVDIYINTSVHEGIPMTILEAMARGIPVIAPDVGGIREIVDHGVQGFLIRGRAPRDFAARCLELIENRELFAAMSTAARDKAVKLFSAHHMADNYHRLYRELVETRS